MHRIAGLTDRAALESLFGPIVSLDRVPFSTPGFSPARHERLTLRLSGGETRRLVMKQVRLDEDWTARRTSDRRGREALLLAEPALSGVWRHFLSPYLAYAQHDGEIGLLMDDLGPWLHVDPTQRLSEAAEDAFLGALAGMHAQFWNSPALNLSWLAPLTARFSILGPGAAGEELARDPGHPLFSMVERGWTLAFELVSSPIADLLLLPPERKAALFTGLPQTLLHGDAKVANLAWLPNSRVAAFDWAVMGVGPAPLDLGYFLAVDTARHARSKERIIAYYQQHLEQALGGSFSPTQWIDLHRAAILGGATMLLWSKALAVDARLPGAEEDWTWWVGQLEQVIQ